MPELTVTLNSPDGDSREIRIRLDDRAYDMLRELALKRGKRVEEIVIEALRLEQLLADRQLLVKEKGRLKELLAV